MLTRLTIFWRMALLVALGGAFVLAVVVGYNYWAAQNTLEDELTTRLKWQASATANYIDSVQLSVQSTAKSLVAAIENTQPGALSRENVFALLEDTVAGDEAIWGITVAADPSASSFRALLAAPYVYRKDDRLARDNLNNLQPSYYMWDWFALPKELGPCWSEPYYDETAGGLLMSSYSVPIRGLDATGQTGEATAQPQFLGVVSAVVSLEWLTSQLAELDLGKDGFAFLISQNGTYIAHPKRELIMNETVFSVSESRGETYLREEFRKMIRGESGIVEAVSVNTGLDSYLVYTPVPSTGWSLCLVVPKTEISQKVWALARIQMLVGGAGLLMLLLLTMLISRSIARPIVALSSATQTMATGDLDAPVPAPRGNDEVARLTRSFTTMRGDLKDYMARLETTVAAKERIESELRIAAEIQMSLVPKVFPPYLGRTDIDISAVLVPAREVGGDFYDFLLLDHDNLCVTIADVSGKGVPAALFMAATRSFLRSFAHGTHSPGEMLARANDELVRDNDTSMFVTVFCAVINLPTGVCRYACGGHNPPFVVRGAEPGSGSEAARARVESLPQVTGALLGVREGMQFEEGQAILGPADLLFLYTDGVTEAIDDKAAEFGEERTRDTLAATDTLTADEVVRRMREVIRDFVGGEEPFDDITMLAVRCPEAEPPA